MHPLVMGAYLSACRYLYDTLGTWIYIPAIALFLLCVFFAIVAADRVRLLLWNYISAGPLPKAISRVGDRFATTLRTRISEST
ncbi:MAG: hypothetical protein NC117_01385 [Pseudoflavonifractor sp.]|nr:hypothetical protein [Pseudoflavonifractor sp.]